ncbi:MAG: Y-family DNA polymerase [Bacteroidota bacterium]
MSRYFALVDCNNFYASCERVFQPQYNGQPVVVLSNNDGCVIARSNEAKALGIPMGEPLFKVKQLVKSKNVKVFSSNYTLYGDMSRRVMEVLHQHCDDMEIYSIDEAFLSLRFAQQTLASLQAWAIRLRRTVHQHTGIPVSIGIGPTKTLAKLANHVAKRHTTTGVHYLPAGNAWLGKLAVDKVWGVGRAYVRRLGVHQVQTVADLVAVKESWMRQEFGVVGLRLLKELKGVPCLELDPPISGRKHTMVSRSFSHDLYDLPEIQRRLALYATRLGEKLRQYNQAAGVITVYLWVNKFKNQRKDGRTGFARSLTLPLATSNTNQLIKYSAQIAAKLYEAGNNYKKAGILASELRPAGVQQGNLFAAHQPHQRASHVMETLDQINRRMGRDMVYFASCGHRPKIPFRQEYRSPCYTTKWTDILTID